MSLRSKKRNQILALAFLALGLAFAALALAGGEARLTLGLAALTNLFAAVVFYMQQRREGGSAPD